MSEPKCATARQPVAKELLERFNILANRADNIACNTRDKLNQLIIPRPQPPCCEDSIDTEYPPLLHEYRCILEQIQSSLDIIEATIEAVEI
jgi:hypothetical protein